jgi:hypothetical protein
VIIPVPFFLLLLLLRLLPRSDDKTAGSSAGFAAAMMRVRRCNGCCKASYQIPVASYQLFTLNIEKIECCHRVILAHKFLNGQGILV